MKNNIRKSVRRWLALVMTAIMVFAMATTVMADTTANSTTGNTTNVAVDSNITSGSITINNGTGSYVYYKIASAAVGEGDATYTYTLVSTYANAFISVFGENWTWEDVATADSSEMKKLADALEAIVTAENFTLDGTSISGTASNLDLGYYLIVETGNSDDLTRTQPILVALPQISVSGDNAAWVADISVTPKASSVTFEKKIVSNDRDKENEWVDTSAEAIGDEIDYVLKSSIPQYDWELVKKADVKYVISDTLSNGLTLDSTSITVYASNSDLEDVDETDKGLTKLTEDSDYDLTYDVDAGTFSVSFTGTYDNIDEYTYIYVFFTATLNEDAKIATDSNPNEAKLTYSNDYTDATEISDIEDKVESYTFKFNLSKVDEDDNTALAGAEFTLKDSDGTAIALVASTDGTSYRVATSDDTVTTTTITSIASGSVVINGLDEGTYTLTETQAPDGYTIYDGTISFTIEAEMVSNEYTGSFEVKKNDVTQADYTITVEDEKGLTLPGTGGIGTTLFTFGGLALVILAAIMFIVYTKKQRKQA
ncbi:MAG: SpaH/EbpB family LPXTG-anchored major pilin [Clostridiales bacterium]|nr:SpaH/EbpB family LPXTG-anchored major pilin [Clostridiales bacterium]